MYLLVICVRALKITRLHVHSLTSNYEPDIDFEIKIFNLSSQREERLMLNKHFMRIKDGK